MEEKVKVKQKSVVKKVSTDFSDAMFMYKLAPIAIYKLIIVMISQALIAFLLSNPILCYPQSFRVPEIKNAASPGEVNALTEHKQFTRSIGTNVPISQNKIEDTIKEVENMLRANPTLPRLTRGEILDLIENITQEDKAKGKLFQEEKGEVKRDPKAIMVVKPFTLSSINDKSLEEWFTRPPITHIVGGEASEVGNNVRVQSLKGESSEEVEFAEKDINKKTTRGRKKTVKETTLDDSTSTTSTSPYSISTEDTATQPRNTTHHRRRRPQHPTDPTGSTQRPRVRRPVRRRPTTTEKHPNHKYPDEDVTEDPKKSQQIESLPSDGIKIVEAPKFNPIVDDLVMQEDEQKNVFVKQDVEATFGEIPDKQGDVGVENSTAAQTVADLNSQEFKDTKAGPSKNRQRKPVSIKKKTQEEEEEEKLKEMLASLGVVPMKTTTTTTRTIPDISNVADNLTPEMRDLLMSFGLIQDPKETGKPSVSITTTTTTTQIPESFNPVIAEVKPEYYSNFKPLPDDDTSRNEMKELLARFGLGRSTRKRKSLPKDEGERISLDVVPDQYKGVLEDIGLGDREGKIITAEALKTGDKEHVFSPTESEYASDEELYKLNKLLDFVKKLENLNRTVTDEDIKEMDVKNIKELLANLNKEKIVTLDEQNAPNPVHFDEGLDRNEVKRQSTTTTSSPKTDVEEIKPIVELNVDADDAKIETIAPLESATPDLKGLEESFGGQVDSGTVTVPPAVEATTAARKTGFYYLVDWNTFLDIDDQKGKRVNLRFQPTVGDPKRFYSVSVP
ncbi:hypothetical protein NQ317_003370 [Molorchus minor]|uniref:Uncharacterized protein n=1 Tax=Molorchus minor TaxID=1323400 RepID=A0ABQ9K629_9CUCU|nr:hypothetical protein NQ317_003370 [Molorchus minor]